MALVVLLRGVNVGGHRTFRPTTLAEQLRHLDAVNVGAAGTFVIRHAQLEYHHRDRQGTGSRRMLINARINSSPIASRSRHF